MPKAWYVYMVKCADNSLYTGVTTDLQRRLVEHNESDLGAKYTRHRRPVVLVYHELATSRSAACKREYQIKHWSRPQKLKLLAHELNDES